MAASGDQGQATIGRLLAEATERLRAAGSETARLDAEVLLGHVIATGRSGLIAHPEVVVRPAQRSAFDEAVERRAVGEPVAYIRGLKEFYSLAFSIDRRALIPRPETELLFELVVDRLREMLTTRPRPVGAPPLRAWDVGTGSGALAVTVAVECRRRGYAGEVRLLASDLSPDALALATENAVAHGVADMIDFAVADLLAVPDAPAVDVLAANLPYVPSAKLPELPVAARFEPRLALDGGADGLEVIRRLLDGLPGALAAGGVCLLEIGSDHADGVRDEVERRLPGWGLTVHADLAGRPRVAELGPT